MIDAYTCFREVLSVYVGMMYLRLRLWKEGAASFVMHFYENANTKIVALEGWLSVSISWEKRRLNIKEFPFPVKLFNQIANPVDIWRLYHQREWDYSLKIFNLITKHTLLVESVLQLKVTSYMIKSQNLLWKNSCSNYLQLCLIGFLKIRST